MTELVDVEAQARMRRYKMAAGLTTLGLILLGMALLLVLAVVNSGNAVLDARKATTDAREAVEKANRTEHNLCVAVKGILKRDRETIQGSPQQTAGLLKKLGYTDKQIRDFIEAQKPLIAAEIAKRPDLDCKKQAKPVKPPVTTTTGTTTRKR